MASEPAETARARGSRELDHDKIGLVEVTTSVVLIGLV